MSPITVLGASGFIGSALVARLKQSGIEYLAPGRDEKLSGRRLGDILYCVGLTADFRAHPFETVEAHVCHLLRILRDCEFNSLVYLSSARIYQKQNASGREEDVVQVSSLNKDDLYNISKVMGESLSLASGKKTKVVRLSNVYGEDYASRNFLATIIREAISTATVTVHNPPDAEKDYVSIHDVVDGLIKIAAEGRHRIYNLAGGMNLSNLRLTQRISELTGCQITFASAPAGISFPSINIDRMRLEFGYQPRNLLDDLSKLVDAYRKHHEEQKA
jgi:nucleoside-diphosphate-sugar epimerase